MPTDRERELSAMLEKYQELGNYDHIRDLLAAEKDGRLVTLPCKVGSTVWVSPNCGKSFHTGKLYGVNERGAHLIFVDDSERYGVQNPLNHAHYDWFFKVYTRAEAEKALEEKK